jgi:hypothetical protein
MDEVKKTPEILSVRYVGYLINCCIMGNVGLSFLLAPITLVTLDGLMILIYMFKHVIM